MVRGNLSFALPQPPWAPEIASSEQKALLLAMTVEEKASHLEPSLRTLTLSLRHCEALLRAEAIYGPQRFCHCEGLFCSPEAISLLRSLISVLTAPGYQRLLRRFAPRNDSGGCTGSLTINLASVILSFHKKPWHPPYSG